MERELRRKQSILSITGAGVIAFGLWSFLKINLYFLMARDKYFSDLPAAEDVSSTLVNAIIYGFILLFAVLNLLLHIYIGRAAIYEALNSGKHRAYLGIVIIMIIANGLSVLVGITQLDFGADTFFDQIASELVDLTVFIMLIELASATTKIRKLRKTLCLPDGRE